MEHGYGGISDALPCLRAENSSTWAKKALDHGPQGIMFPMIDGPNAARNAVSYCRYQPNGVRGCAHSVIRASGYGIDQGYILVITRMTLLSLGYLRDPGNEKVMEVTNAAEKSTLKMKPVDGGAYLSGVAMPHDKRVPYGFRSN
ncbi:hypothetical protein BC332_09111 [Capsicum chinense]|nr:hypothetical protein BC332_09111 [Capsicum chinense]